MTCDPEVGRWLDAATDRVKEFAVYAGLAIGAGGNGDDVWWVAIALIVLQTSRHMSDYDFARIQKTREAQAPRADIRDPSDPLPEGEGRLAGAVQVSARVNRRSAIRWMKKIQWLPQKSLSLTPRAAPLVLVSEALLRAAPQMRLRVALQPCLLVGPPL